MPDAVVQGLATLIRTLEDASAFLLLLGFVVATFHWVRNYPRDGALPDFESYRKAIARVVLTGIEILVAATIIKTIIIDPTLEQVGYLAIMVAIRTFLGWTTSLEMSGRWPWQKQPAPARSQTTSEG
ncbi:DUF1622 domain-containing protein [Deltaproteobacteria bacterium]|nr:DUF1622 domain-containing protein [Deltaproteobacteria bacterium]